MPEPHDYVIPEFYDHVTPTSGTFNINLTSEQLGQTLYPSTPDNPIENNDLPVIGEPGVPFLDIDGRWYVRFDTAPRSSDWWCERQEQNFQLITPVDWDRFGDHAYLIRWIDPPDYEEEYEPELDDGYSVEREVTETGEHLPVFTTNIGRVVPLISIEQEFSGDGDRVAGALYHAELGYTRYPDGYHMSEGRMTRDMGDKICYVETDSSCGYELIFDRLNLRDRLEAEKFMTAQNMMREFRDGDSIRLSARCGFHIHVDVGDWGMKEIVSAYHLWNYLEDPIFRFASAFWSSHRDEEVGGGYSPPVPKGIAGRAHLGSRLYDRRDSLNFTHILRAKINCSCGASVYEDWANCSCNLRQPTLEFRVFNATLNQRKIRAYLAFCIGFVNQVKKVDHDPITHPVMRWRGTNTYETEMEDDVYLHWNERALERIKYILNEFPITNSERGDIRYTMENSSLESIVSQL